MPSKKQRLARSSVFGCLVADTECAYFNGLRRANDGFLKAIIRYSKFKEIHVFAPQALLSELKLDWNCFLQNYGSDKSIHFLPAHELNKYFSKIRYQVFHHSDPWIGHLAALRDSYCLKPFPITGRAHNLSTDSNMSNTRDLLLSPLKSCDAILCSSSAQKKVMIRLLSSASSSISVHIGAAIPYKGSVVKLPLGIELDECFSGSKEEARELLNIKTDQFVILTLGRVSPSYKMDLNPVLLVINDLVEGYGHRNIVWVIAGAGDAASSSVQYLLKQAYNLNLEGSIRFELDIDDERKNQWLSACDMVLSLSDNIQESFGLVPLEAMVNGKAIVLSDWNGYSELVEDGISGCLIDTVSTDLDHLARPLGTLLTDHAHLLQSQGTAVDLSKCSETIHQLIQSPQRLLSIGEQGRQRVVQNYQWESVIDDYHKLVDQLNKEADQISRLNNRPVGLPYHQIFEHYPSHQLEENTFLKTTDRGVRMLLKSEKFHHYSEMEEFLKPDLIDQIAQICLSGDNVGALNARFPHESALLLNIIWMCKYQLLEYVDEQLQSRSENRWWPEELRLPAEIINRLDCAEPHRFRLLEPVLCWLDTQLSSYHQQLDNVELRISLLKFMSSKMDEQLLQAIGWVGEMNNTHQYSDILDYIYDQGGLSFLGAEFPLWYRLNRLRVIHTLRDFKKLFSRFHRDVDDLNRLFSDRWQKPAQKISKLGFPLSVSPSMVATVFCDNDERLVYKNRDLSIEKQIIGFTDDNKNIAGKLNLWLEGEPGLATLRILTGSFNGSYGFCEFVDRASQEVLSQQQAGIYYQRLGVISGLSIMLGLGDMHNRNIISSNGIPYIVDVKAAFCPGVIKAFESELNDPQRAFCGADNSFQKTSIPSVFEQFHFNGFKDCLYELVNGVLIDTPSIEEHLVTNNLIQVRDDRSCSNSKPPLCSQYVNDFEKGIESVFRGVASHYDEWRTLLHECRGMAVYHLQRYNQQFFWQQKVNLWTFYGFQSFSRLRLKTYFHRVINRLCQGEEEIQRWVEPQWFEPAAHLSDELTRSLLSGVIVEFKRSVGEKGVFCENSGGCKKVISANYFSVDTLSKSIELVRDMAGDSQKMEYFLTFLTAIIKRWMLDQVKPGRNIPDIFKEKLPD